VPFAACALREPGTESFCIGRTHTNDWGMPLAGREARRLPVIRMVIAILYTEFIKEQLVFGVAQQARIYGAPLVQAGHPSQPAVQQRLGNQLASRRVVILNSLLQHAVELHANLWLKPLCLIAYL
jgi:hypothetical protein